MKLVFLSHISDCSGGAQRCLLDLLKGIKQAHPDWRIYMIFPNQEGDLIDTCSPYMDGYTSLWMEWWLVDDTCMTLGKRLMAISRMLKYSMKLTSYLREIKPDYGITNTLVLPHLAFACKMLGIKHCWFIHEIPDLTWSNFTPIIKYRLLFKLIDKLSTKIVVTSQCAKLYYQKVMTKEKVSVITQAVDLPLIPTVSLNHGERYSILMVGAFDSNKGQLELLGAVKRIVSEGRDILCRLVGPDAGFMPACQRYVMENALEGNVEIAPYAKQVGLYYDRADVLLVCSGFETFCRVAVEAQQYRLPVILSDVGANSERIEDGVNGLLYQKGNMADLIEKIERLRDSAVRKRFSEQIHPDTVRKRYGVEHFASSFCALLNR